MLAQLLLELRAHISVPARKGHSTKLWGPQPRYGIRQQPGASVWSSAALPGLAVSRTEGHPLLAPSLGYSASTLPLPAHLLQPSHTAKTCTCPQSLRGFLYGIITNKIKQNTKEVSSLSSFNVSLPDRLISFGKL